MNRLVKRNSYGWAEKEQEIRLGPWGCSLTLTTGMESDALPTAKISTNLIRTENIPGLRLFIEELSDAFNLLDNQE